MTTDSEIDLKAGRRHVARSRGALSGVLLVILGAWAALVPFIGPYFNFGFEPRANDAWHWTSGRGWFEVLPGAVAVIGGLLLLLSSSRFVNLVASWIAALAGAWLVIGLSLAGVLEISTGRPDQSLRPGIIALEELLYFFATGAAIVLVAGIALGRLSVHSVRDVRAAEHRAEQQALEEQRLEEERRAADERARIDQEHEDERRRVAAANETAVQPADTTTTPGENEVRDGDPGGRAREPDRAGAPNGEFDRPRAAAGSESYLGHHAPSGQQPAQYPPAEPYRGEPQAPGYPQGPPAGQQPPPYDPQQAPPEQR